MHKRIVTLGSVLTVAAAFISTTAMASGIYGPPNTTADWTQEFCLTDCTSTPTTAPVSQVDLIMATSGVTFSSMGPVYTDIGQSTLDSGATSMYGANHSSITFSPSDTSDVYWTMGFSPASTSTPFNFYFELWNGSNFITTNNTATSSDLVSWNGSSWSETVMTSSVPEPASLALIAAGLISLGGVALIRRRRSLES